MSDCEECLSSDRLHTNFCIKKDLLKRDDVTDLLADTFHVARYWKICPADCFVFTLLGENFPRRDWKWSDAVRARCGSVQLRPFRVFIRSIFLFYQSNVLAIPKKVGARVLQFCMCQDDCDYLRLALLHGFGVFADDKCDTMCVEAGGVCETPRQYWILGLDDVPIFDEFARYDKYNKEYGNSYMAVLEFALATRSLDLPVLLTVEVDKWLNSLNKVFIAPVKLIFAWKVAKRVKQTSWDPCV